MGKIGSHVDLTLPPVAADIKQINRSAVNGQNVATPFRFGREVELAGQVWCRRVSRQSYS